MTTMAYEMNPGGAKSEFVMTQFTPEEFQKFWPKLEKELDRVPHTWNHWTKEHIYGSVMSDMMQVWGIGPPPKAVYIVMTAVNVYPAMRVLSVVWGMGSYDDRMMPLLDAALTGYARLNSCEEIEIRGRLGWDPKLRAIGFKRTAMVWTRPVDRSVMN